MFISQFVGLSKNSITKALDKNRVYTAGRYLLGVGYKFTIRFPATYQHVEFSKASEASADVVMAQTNGDGGTVYMECAFQYKLKPEKINGESPLGLYQYYGEKSYQRKIANLAKSSMVNSVKLVKVQDFYTQREFVKSTVLNGLIAQFKNDGDYIEITGFQLGFTKFPITTESNIIKSSKENQKKEMTMKVREAKLVETQSFKIDGNATAQITELKAMVDSEARIVRNLATSGAKKIALEAQQVANLELRDRLSFDNKELMRYLWLKTLNTTGETDTVVSPSTILFFIFLFLRRRF